MSPSERDGELVDWLFSGGNRRRRVVCVRLGAVQGCAQVQPPFRPRGAFQCLDGIQHKIKHHLS